MDRSKEDTKIPAPCALWPVDLKLTHIDCSSQDTLVHFQGQYVTVCELDYNILQVEIQNAQKATVSVEVGEFCLVEDVLSGRWYRGRVQNKQRGLSDVFLLDHGNVITVGPKHIAAVSEALLMLPPKIVCGFFANVLPVQECWDTISEKFFLSLIGSQVKGYIHALLPYKVLILEAPEITKELVGLNLGKHVDTDTFLVLVEMLIEVPVQQSIGSVPDLLIEKQNAQEISFKPSSLQGFEKIFSLGGPRLVAGQKERASITAAVNSGLFYCQLSSVTKDLREMSEKLALTCESRSSKYRDKAVENLGLLCAIKGKDEMWHRGFVQCLPVNSQVRVVLFDYGYCESVKVENILQLPSDFLQTPIMAFPCSLSCLSDKDEDTKCQQLQLLKNGLLGKELEVTVDNLNEEDSVYSVTLSSVEENAHIKTLQSKGIDELEKTDILKSEHNLKCLRSCYTNETEKGETTKDYTPFKDIQEGSVFEGYVEHVKSPNDFWIRTAKRNDDFEAMMNRLSNHFSGLELNEEILEDPVPGVLCCAMYEKDMQYYRALVVDTIEYGAEVFFIDFGNTEKVPSMLIKKLPREFAVEPEFAFNCSLANVSPEEDFWTVVETEFFRKATLNKVFLVQVIHKRKGTFVVDLYERGTDNSESITARMTRANIAASWRCSSTVSPAGIVIENKTDRKKCGQGQFAETSFEKVSQKVTGRRANKEDVCAPENVEKKQAHSESPKSIAKAAELIRHPKLQLGLEMSVQCSYVGSPSEFWCQDKQQKCDLDRLMEDLQAFYQTHHPELQPQSIYCAVKFKQDNRWYRGSIIGVTNNEVEVILVDYGMVVKDRLENIRALMPRFLELKKQAFRCSLYNLIEPVGETCWSEKACTLLKDFVSGGSSDLTCKVYSQIYVANKGLCSVVDLYTPNHQASVHLVEQGVAVKIQCPKQLVPSVYPCTFVYSSFDISVGSEEMVYVTHVVSPWEIYVQLDKNSETMEELMERATTESEDLLSQNCEGNAGPLCLAKFFGDSMWYRSCVWPAQSNLHLNVFFVDYGNRQVAEKRSVLPIPQKAADLLLTPMQALKCSLSNIQEEEHLPEVKTWLESTILNKKLQAKFVAKDNSGHFICDFFDGNMHINEKVKKLFALHKQKEGNSVKKASECCEQRTTLSSADKKKKHKGKCHKGNELDRPIHQAKSAKLKCSSHRPNNSVSKHVQGNEKKKLKLRGQVKGIVTDRFSTPCTFSSKTSEELPKIGDLPKIKIRPGFRGVGFISHCNSVDDFFIHLENDESNILKLGEELNSSLFTKKRITSKLNIGDLVAAEYEEDQALYRAVITNITSSDIISVEFIDYGNTASVDRQKIHPLTSRFLSQCRLSTLCTLSKSHSSEDAETFKERHDTPLMIEFMQNLGNAWEVSLEILDTLHKSRKDDGANVDVSSSGPARPSQEQYPAGTDTKEELTDTTTNSHKCALEIGTKNSTGAQQKPLEKRQRMKTAYMHKSKRHGKPQNAYKIQHGKKQNGIKQQPQSKDDITDTKDLAKQNLSMLCNSSEQDGREREYRSVVYQPASASTYTDKSMEEEGLLQHMFFAPVKVDFEYSGFAAAVTTPYEFYIVLEDLLLLMSAVSIILEETSEALSPLPETHLIPGTGCLVKSDEKTKWCRAEIVQCDDTRVIVNLVDYGHCACFLRQDVHRLKKLPVDLAGLPKITYPCMLRGIKPAGAMQWSDNAVVFFQERMCQRNLQIYFRQCVSEAHWEVDVVTEDSSIAKQLVEFGHACYIDGVLGDQFQQSQDRKRVSQQIIDKFSETTNSKSEVQSQSTEIPRGYLDKMLSSDNAVTSTEESFQGVGRQRETEDSFNTSNDDIGSGRRANDGSAPVLKHCLLM
ncbi:tudor domain-containing protein 15 isoform X2 [Brachyhypopomus gauderio]|uniref:tudor domain-containing protein 15 isoform X2 n=1 Tax=Brachyhypopomus gauderio TaxID=698409 RepID=UPI00404362E9